MGGCPLMVPSWRGVLLLLWAGCFCSVSGSQDDVRGLIFPLQLRVGGGRSRGLLRNATLPLHGAVKDYGYFYATLRLGTPARDFAVIVDTGSTITYVPCASCGELCGTHHKDAAFDPAASATSRQIGCQSEHCMCGRPSCGCSPQQACTYSRTYAEQSSSSGVLVQDQLYMNGGSVPIVFGCETSETGEIFNQEADGILGLGNSEVSIVNQLAAGGSIRDVFSLCFGSVEGNGALLLGDVALPPALAPLRYTPLLASASHPHYYLVDLRGVAVGGDLLVVPEGLYQSGYGAVLDSGTTFTYLPTEAFLAFQSRVAAFAHEHGLHDTRGPDPKFRDTCFGGAPRVEHADQLTSVFPTFELVFAEGQSLEVGPLNYLFMHTGEPGAYCLGVFDNGHQGTLLGGITFRNILVQYDRANRRVGFAPAPCQEIGQQQLKACPEGTVRDGAGQLSCHPGRIARQHHHHVIPPQSHHSRSRSR